MKIIKPYTEIKTKINYEEMLKFIEEIGRICYKSEGNITDESAESFIAEKILKTGHESVIEHINVTVKFVCDRGVSHEIVRHRLASYSQESTRYCNYSSDKFGNEVTFIRPFFFADRPEEMKKWENAMHYAEETYMSLIRGNVRAQEARSVLPNSLKTEIMVTYNLREWRHFFKLRCSPSAHPQMRELTVPLLAEFQKLMPVFFSDIII